MRVKFRRESELPIITKSTTDKDEPKDDTPYTDKDAPRRTKF